MFEGKLNELVVYTAVCIGHVQPAHTQGPMLSLLLAAGTVQGSQVSLEGMPSEQKYPGIHSSSCR